MEHNYATELQDAELLDFLQNAPKTFKQNERIKKFQLKNGDFIHCCLWNYHFYISGTDIVKILIYRFNMEGCRQVTNLKKFEEGIFSDLRNLKPGIDATLEGPRSPFLEHMYKNGCIRTQKKQKVFYWYSVPHDALFCDAMERDIRRESFFINSKNYHGTNQIANNSTSKIISTFNTNNFIFNNTKRNITKQRNINNSNTNALFFDTDMFGTENKVEKGDLLSKALFNQDDSMSNIIKKNNSQKKTSILDEIVNYNNKKSKKMVDTLSEEYFIKNKINKLKHNCSSMPSEMISNLFGNTLKNTNIDELDALIQSVDLKLSNNPQNCNSLNINDFLYTKTKPEEIANKNNETLDKTLEIGSKVTFVQNKKVE